MRLSSSFLAPSAIAILSTALLFGLSGMAMAQSATGSAAQLPSVTVQAPKQVARPHRQVTRPQRSARVTSTVASHPATPITQTSAPAKGSVMAQLATIEKTSSNCADGCQTSFKHGSAPWNGCNGSGGTFSPTCRNVRNFKSYAECSDHGLLLGWRSGEIYWYCGSLVAGQKFAAADQRSARR